LPPPEHRSASAGRAAALARHQTLFREVNDRIRALAARSGPETTWEFFCECGDLCGQTLGLALEDYDRVRRKRRRFIVRTGHEDTEAEHVVHRHDGWLVVELAAGVTPPRDPF